MLSKSQARAFFLGGTVIFSLVFVVLTVDTFNRIPGQTNSKDLTPEVIRGKHLFERNNCMGCHTILGEGAYYAPELTRVWERRGETYIKAMLKDPQGMFPNDRKMTNYHFSDQEISDLAQFLKWIGQMDLNGFPPRAQAVSATASAAVIARPVTFNQLCTACHSLDGQGGQIGPALDGVGAKFDEAYFRKRLTDPQSIQVDSKMPKLPLSEDNLNELVQFLSQLKGGK